MIVNSENTYNDTVTHVIGLRDPATGQVRVFILQPIDVDSQAMPDELNMDHLFQRTD